MGTGWTVDTGERAGNDANRPLCVEKFDDGNVLARDALVARGRHFVLGRQVDPELHHLEQAAPARKVRTMKLLVHQS